MCIVCEIRNKLAIEVKDADAIAAISAKAKAIPAGVPGECDLCGEWSGRLVNGACAPCRDRHNLP